MTDIDRLRSRRHILEIQAGALDSGARRLREAADRRNEQAAAIRYEITRVQRAIDDLELLNDVLPDIVALADTEHERTTRCWSCHCGHPCDNNDPACTCDPG